MLGATGPTTSSLLLLRPVRLGIARVRRSGAALGTGGPAGLDRRRRVQRVLSAGRPRRRCPIGRSLRRSRPRAPVAAVGIGDRRGRGRTRRPVDRSRVDLTRCMRASTARKAAIVGSATAGGIRSAAALRIGVIGSTADSGSVSPGSSPGSAADGAVNGGIGLWVVGPRASV